MSFNLLEILKNPAIQPCHKDFYYELVFRYGHKTGERYLYCVLNPATTNTFSPKPRYKPWERLQIFCRNSGDRLESLRLRCFVDRAGYRGTPCLSGTRHFVDWCQNQGLITLERISRNRTMVYINWTAIDSFLDDL